MKPRQCTWHLDTPVGNSGRLRGILLQVAEENNWNWEVELVPDPDAVLIASDAVVASADSLILDRCRRWINLARIAIDAGIPAARIVPMTGS